MLGIGVPGTERTVHEVAPASERFLTSGSESGTAPGDRTFRPDVEGLRALAVVLVVLYHANLCRVTGGYVGVDVFFVISGFVITGLLLRERFATGRTSILDFYARRARRILPAATLVIVATVFMSYFVLGSVSGGRTANDGRWAALFLSNFHFQSVGTDYLTATLPPSALQNYWSLSVEEQFYVVYPTLFLLVAGIWRRTSRRARLAGALAVIAVGSFVLSVLQTSSSPSAAYFSPFTRAWELALGALVAVGTESLLRMPRRVAVALTWTGFGAILYSAFAFNTHTAYPGSLVAIPVAGAAAIIAGGTSVPRLGAEIVLGLGAFRWLGRLSYSIYLWHWPILVIATEYAAKNGLSLGERLLLLSITVGISFASFHFVENPIRHWRLPSRTSVAAGATVITVTCLVITLVLNMEGGDTSPSRVAAAADEQQVLALVAAAAKIRTIPNPIVPPPVAAFSDFGANDEGAGCKAGVKDVSERICPLGDTKSTQLMVVYGDSHALQWLPAFAYIANAAHWKLIMLGKFYCPAGLVTIVNLPTWSDPSGPDSSCDQWHTWAVREINKLQPNLLVVTQDNSYAAPASTRAATRQFSLAQWKTGLSSLFRSIHLPKRNLVLLGTTPSVGHPGAACLSAHPDDVQACSTIGHPERRRYAQIERDAALQSGVRYVNPYPWFCSRVCTVVIGHYLVYGDNNHVTGAWAKYLGHVLGEALGVLPRVSG